MKTTNNIVVEYQTPRKTINSLALGLTSCALWLGFLATMTIEAMKGIF